jgi:hydrogenase-1 operon protein HyaF
MNAPETIAVRAEFETGNVRPLLHEIRHALVRLADGGDGTVIDLQSLPLAPGEERRIEEALGQGEIAAELNALGRSSIVETAYPGVWMITHRNTEDEVIGRFIEVTRVPALLKAQPEDVQAGLERLTGELEEHPETENH